jgi:pseudouridine kinase
VPGPVVDVTGAGDALVAGTLAALLTDADLDRAVTAGARLAAATVASPASVVPATETGPGRSPL